MRTLTLALCVSLTASLSAYAQDSDDVDTPAARARAAPTVAQSDDTPEAASSAIGTTTAGAEAARKKLAREPKVEAVVSAALAHFDAGAGNPTSVAKRARRAGWVPRITAGMRRGQGLDYATYQGDTARLDQSTDGDLTLYAALTFELDRVVFRSEEVGLLRERRAAQDARAERAEAVLALYYERQRALIELVTEGPSPERELKVAYSTARLDAFTNGAFTRMIRASNP